MVVSERATMSAGVRAPVDRGNATTDFADPGADPEAFFLNGDLGGNTAGLSGNSHQMHPNPSKSWFIIITFPVSQADASEVVGKAAELLRREENMVKLQVWTAGYGSRP